MKTETKHVNKEGEIMDREKWNIKFLYRNPFKFYIVGSNIFMNTLKQIPLQYLHILF